MISGKCEIKELTQQSNYVTTNHGRLIPGQQAYEDVSLQRGSRLRLNDALSHIDGVHDEESLQEFLFHGNEEPTKTSELPSAVFNSFTEASFYCLPRSLQTIQWVKEQSENVRFTTMKLS